MKPLKIFIGWDPREPAAFHVLSHSILSRSSVPVSITPLHLKSLILAGLYERQRNNTESTQFAFSRFLVPLLSGFEGTSIFMDCDMLCLADVWELVEHCAKGEYPVSCCQHDYVPRETTKFLGQAQTVYPRKNWSSLMVFDNHQCRRLTRDYVNTATGAELHRFQWLREDGVGAIPLEWNYLVGEDNQSKEPPKIVHFTNGGPWFAGYDKVEHADAWIKEWESSIGIGGNLEVA